MCSYGGLNVIYLLYAHMFKPPGAQLGALLKKVTELSGSAVLLEEVLHWRQALRVCSLTLLPVLSCCFLCAAEM